MIYKYLNLLLKIIYIFQILTFKNKFKEIIIISKNLIQLIIIQNMILFIKIWDWLVLNFQENQAELN